MSFAIPLPRYRCHKVVSALKVSAVTETENGFALHFFDRRFSPHEVSREWVSSRKAAAVGYLVVYEDGYESWSPVAAFEDGYTLIEDESP